MWKVQLSSNQGESSPVRLPTWWRYRTSCGWCQQTLLDIATTGPLKHSCSGWILFSILTVPATVLPELRWWCAVKRWDRASWRHH